MVRKKKQTSILDRTIALTYPRLTEIQIFVLLFSLGSLLIYSSELRLVVWDLLAPDSLPPTLGKDLFMYIFGLLVILAPVLTLVRIVLSKPLGELGEYFTGLSYFLLFGIMCMRSLDSMSAIQSGSLLHEFNQYMGRIMLVFLAVRCIAQAIFLDSDVIRKRMVNIITDHQYRPIHFGTAAIIATVIMYMLSHTYTYIWSLAFLTASYSLFTLWVLDHIIRIVHGVVAPPPHQPIATSKARRVSLRRS